MGPNPGSVQLRSATSRREGRHWVVAAVGMPALLALGVLTVRLSRRNEACVDRYGPTSTRRVGGVPGPCAEVAEWTSLLVLVCAAAVVASVVVGVVLGLVDGRRRRRFAYGRWVCVVVVGLTAPWALIAYAPAYGLGRLLPAHRPRARRLPPAEMALQQGWAAAIHLYQRLLRGEPPPTVVAPGFIGPGIVHWTLRSADGWHSTTTRPWSTSLTVRTRS
ncbi:hypothetical protein [Micromonospora sp. NPDC126480]|uniref:hypothetical protein n=1 Tax=Micromonospora sp. NPDC126480 TaxID=3155312 RepID=UPI003322CC3B